MALDLDLSGELARDPADLLAYEGADVGDLLQRLAATDLAPLAEGEGGPCLFTDDRGRVVDLPLLRRAEDRWLLLASEGRAEALAAWIERFVILEDVRRVPEPFPRAIERVDSSLPGGRALALEPAPGRAPLDAAAVQSAFLKAGRWRPGPPPEFQPHPLEVGLREHVSFTKGCYVGQEVVARMDSYDKIRRAPAWIDASPPALAAGSELRHAGREAGFVLMSVAGEPRLLAALRRDLSEGSGIDCEDGPLGPLRWVPERD